MKFKNIRLKDLLIHLCIAAVYPLFACYTADSNPLLRLINALTVVGLIYLVIGVFCSFSMHGDLDITEYFALRRVMHKTVKSFENFKKDKTAQREGRFNYPLLLGIIMLAAAAVMALFFY